MSRLVKEADSCIVSYHYPRELHFLIIALKCNSIWIWMIINQDAAECFFTQTFHQNLVLNLDYGCFLSHNHKLLAMVELKILDSHCIHHYRWSCHCNYYSCYYPIFSMVPWFFSFSFVNIVAFQLSSEWKITASIILVLVSWFFILPSPF